MTSAAWYSTTWDEHNIAMLSSLGHVELCHHAMNVLRLDNGAAPCRNWDAPILMRCATLIWKRFDFFYQVLGRRMHVKAPSIGMHTRRTRVGHKMYASPGWSQVPGGADHPPGRSGVMRRSPPPGAACRFSYGSSWDYGGRD